MAKTHTKINQLAGDKPKGFAYANNTDKELVDDILATRDETNGYTEIAREYNSRAQNIIPTTVGLNDLSAPGVFTGTIPTTYTVTIDGVNQTFLQVYTSTISGGSFAVSDTVTNGTGGSATILSILTGGNQLLRVTINSGSFSSGDVIDNGSGVTGTLNNNQELYDTITYTDGVTTETNVPTFTEAYFVNGIAFVFGAQIGHTLSDSWQINFFYITVTTGFESNQVTFPGVPSPLDASAIVATDGVDKMAVGILDLSPFGPDKLTAGILALYGDGSQSTYTQNRVSADLNIFDVATGKGINASYAGSGYSINGYDGSTDFGLNVDTSSFRYDTNGNTFTLPSTTNVPGSVATDVNGNGIITMEPLPSSTGATVSGSVTLTSANIQDRNQVDNSWGVVTISLPDPTTVTAWKGYTFKQVTSNIINSITINPFAAETIDGLSSYIFPTPIGGYISIDVYTDGINWFIS